MGTARDVSATGFVAAGIGKADALKSLSHNSVSPLRGEPAPLA